MAMKICECCGQSIRKPKLRVLNADPVDTAAMTDKQLFAHYKKIAPYADLWFFMNNAKLSKPLQDRALALLMKGDATGRLTIPRADWYHELTAIQADWRRETGYPKPVEDTVAA